MKTLEEKIKELEKTIEIGDKVIVYHGGSVLKKGIVVGLTSCGANVYNPNKKEAGNYDTLPERAEWFAFRNIKRTMKDGLEKLERGGMVFA